MRLQQEIKLTPAEVAEAFCDLGDEQQAQVFIEIALIGQRWRAADERADPNYQWWLVGRHLRACSCATEEARDVVRELAGGLSYVAPHPPPRPPKEPQTP